MSRKKLTFATSVAGLLVAAIAAIGIGKRKQVRSYIFNPHEKEPISIGARGKTARVSSMIIIENRSTEKTEHFPPFSHDLQVIAEKAELAILNHQDQIISMIYDKLPKRADPITVNSMVTGKFRQELTDFKSLVFSLKVIPVESEEAA